MREKGELDTQIYQKVKKDMAAVKKNEVQPREFPSQAEKMAYPGQALKVGSPLYETSSMSYGRQQPSH